jgi:hypothetical protein
MRRISVPAILVLAVCQVSARHGQTQTQPQNNSSRQQYSIAEYNAYETAAREMDAAKQILLLDEFVSNHPQSALLIYVYPLYYAAYGQLKNFPKVVIYADKLAALGDRVDAANSSDPELAAKARSSALAGIELLSELKKPDLMDEKAFALEKKRMAIYFHATAGIAAIAMKDYSAAAESFRAVMTLNAGPLLTDP